MGNWSTHSSLLFEAIIMGATEADVDSHRSEAGVAAGVSTPKTVGIVRISKSFELLASCYNHQPHQGPQTEAQIIAGYRVAEQTCRND